MFAIGLSVLDLFSRFLKLSKAVALLHGKAFKICYINRGVNKVPRSQCVPLDSRFEGNEIQK